MCSSDLSLDPANARRCAELTGVMQAECRAMMIKDLAIQSNDPGLCRLIAADQTRIRSYCDLHFWPSRTMTAREQDEAVRQILARNVLLERREDGRYEETAEARGLEIGGWSWDVSTGDFDLDGWQDVYIVNGTWVPNEVTPSNIFLRNRGNGDFEELTPQWGLEDYLMTAAASLADFDGDGDLDIVTVPVNGPPVHFRNNVQDTNALAIRLIDEAGNRDAIGARLELRTDAGLQVRELQLGGGFMSFDAPVAHFGLGEHAEAGSLSIRWPDGAITELSEPLAAGSTYTITRRLDAPVGE